MVVATADASGRPSVRYVLLKGLDERGLVFYTNYDSAKAADLAVNPVASVLFPWHALERQVRITGGVERVDAALSDAYFSARPYGSQIGAWSSRQSAPAASRGELDEAYASYAARFPGQAPVPRPDFWGGYRVAIDTAEFWQGRVNRLHDRLRYRRSDDGAAGSWSGSSRSAWSLGAGPGAGRGASAGNTSRCPRASRRSAAVRRRSGRHRGGPAPAPGARPRRRTTLVAAEVERVR